MDKTIYIFKNEYYFLSNFYLCKIEINGLVFDNAEAAFHSFKNDLYKKEFVGLSASMAKRYGRRVSLRSDWEEVKDDIMYNVVYAKFSQNPYLKDRLLATVDRVLVEGNFWHDNYWGICCCNQCQQIESKNKLGHILMKVRDELREK